MDAGRKRALSAGNGRDPDTLRWMGRIVGKADMIHVQQVGPGSYGIMEVERCEHGEIERTLRAVGFESAHDAEMYAEFMREEMLQERLKQHEAMPGHAPSRAGTLQQIRERAEHQIRFLPVCMTVAVTNRDLDEIAGSGLGDEDGTAGNTPG